MISWIGPLFLTVGVLAAGLGVWVLLRHLGFMRRAEVAQGEITGYAEEHSGGSDGSTVYYPIVRFATSEGLLERRCKVGASWRTGQIGRQVNVYYLRDEPQGFKLKTIANVMLAIVPIGIGVVFMGIGAVLSRAVI